MKTSGSRWRNEENISECGRGVKRRRRSAGRTNSALALREGLQLACATEAKWRQAMAGGVAYNGMAGADQTRMAAWRTAAARAWWFSSADGGAQFITQLLPGYHGRRGGNGVAHARAFPRLTPLSVNVKNCVAWRGGRRRQARAPRSEANRISVIELGIVAASASAGGCAGVDVLVSSVRWKVRIVDSVVSWKRTGGVCFRENSAP